MIAFVEPPIARTVVIEKLEELRQIIPLSKQLGVEPIIGIRARLMSKGAGKWAESGGENAKFGLSTVELLAATDAKVVDVAMESGYQSTSLFNLKFKQRFGVSPAKWRDRVKKHKSTKEVGRRLRLAA